MRTMDTKAAQRQLIGLITQHLSESIPVTRILKYQPSKNGSVDGRFESLGRVFNFTFNGDDVKYKPSGNMDSALFSEYYLERFDAAPKTLKGTRALPKCTSKSYSCKGAVGVACITLTKSCRMGTTAIGNERLNKIKGLAKMLASSGGDASKLEASHVKIVEGRLALAVENRAKREPKKIEKATAEVAPAKVSKPKKVKVAKAKKDDLAEKINDYNEFKKTTLDIYPAEAYGRNSRTLSIPDLRGALGARLTHEQFDDWMLKLTRDNSADVTLHPISDQDLKAATKDDLKNLVYNKELKTYMEGFESEDLYKAWIKKPRPLETKEKRKTEDGNQIFSAKDFEDVALKTFADLTKGNTSGNPTTLVHEIRRAIGDRVTHAQFNDWMKEIDRNNVLIMHGGGKIDLTTSETKDSIYSDILHTLYAGVTLPRK